jgi:uncharacterized protein
MIRWSCRTNMRVQYTPQEVNTCIHNIIRMMYNDNFKPDYIVGITRGGLIPAIKLSHYLDIPMNALKVSLRNDGESETNCWMAEDAFGYKNTPKNILIIDDICDTGATFDWIIKDWQSTCLPDSEKWDEIWHGNVKFASLIYNEACGFDVDYDGKTINTVTKPEWCVFPWEDWW